MKWSEMPVRSLRGLRFDPETHSYFLRGQVMPGVTTVLATSGLCDMSFGAGVEYLDRGVLVHDVTARMDRGERVDMRTVPRRWRGHVAAWEKFKRDAQPEVVLVEHVVCNGEWAGTLDRLVWFPHEKLRTVLDLKCSRTGGPGDWCKYQLVAYGAALEPGQVFGRTAVTLHEDGTYTAKSWPLIDWLEDLAQFRAAVRMTLGSMEFAKVRSRLTGARGRALPVAATRVKP